MPDFTFTSPEGKKYTVTGPPGATSEQAFQILQGQIGGQAALEPAQPEAPADAPQKPSSGVIGQGLKGVLEGAASLPVSIYRDILGIATGQKQPTGPPQFGQAPQPGAESYARSVGQALGNPQSYLGPGGALPKVLGAIGGGAGAQAGGDIGGTPGAIVGGLLGGAVGGGLVKPKAPVSNVPTTSEIGATAKASYRGLAKAKHPVEPLVANVFVADTRKALIDEDFFPAETPKTFKYLERLADPTDPPTSSTVMSVRRQLGRAIRQAHTDPDEAAAAELARRHLDQFFEKNTPFGPQLAEANANYRAAKGAEAIEKQQLKGELSAAQTGTPASEDTAMRTAMKQLLLSPKFSGSPRVREELEKAIRGGWTANTARWFGRYAPTHTIREVSKAIGGRATGSRVDMINEMIRLESPLANQRGSTPTPSKPGLPLRLTVGAARQAAPKPENRLYEE